MFFHIWFVTKYRKAILDGQLDKFVKDIFAECIERHKYKVLELQTDKNHVHMLVEAVDKKELSAIVRTLKSVSAKIIHETPCFRMGNPRFIKFRSDEEFHKRKPVDERKSFWARRYGYNEISKYEIENMRTYIRVRKGRGEMCKKT